MSVIFSIAISLLAALAFPAAAQEARKDMILLPPGKFTMGTDHNKIEDCAAYFGKCDDTWYSKESPPHTVSLDGFFMDKHEVTQGDFYRVMKNNPSFFMGATRPVERVSWHDAAQYCAALGKRLPTEAEWEYAVRAGSRQIFYWGEDVGRANANCDQCGSHWSNKETAPVGSFSPNAFGLHDMSGNVWEWVEDWFDPNYYKKSEKKNPAGPPSGKEKVIRGGSWYDTPYFARVTTRGAADPGLRSDTIGFRCALTARKKDFEKKPETIEAEAPRESTAVAASAKKPEELAAEDLFHMTSRENVLEPSSLLTSAQPKIPPPLAPPPESPFGRLQVKTNAPLAKVTVSGKYRGTTMPKEPLSLDDLKPGQVLVRVEAEGYKPMEKMVSVAPRLWTSEAFQLEKEIPGKTPPAIKPQAPAAEPLAALAGPPNMALIPAGAFQAGADPDALYASCEKYSSNCELRKSWFASSYPPHEVELDAFFIDQREVTQADFDHAMGHNPSKVKNPSHPVEMVTWFEAKQYCERVGKRLPTEMEWEKAARGGASTIYPWGDADDPAYSWDVQNSALASHPVGQKRPNVFGLYDMTGNVWEWVADWFSDEYYKDAPRKDPKGPASGTRKSLRGGSFETNPFDKRPTARIGTKPDSRLKDLGFRCAMSFADFKR